MKNNKVIGIGIFFVLLLIPLAFATPNSINIQGKLTSTGGTLQTGTFNFTFNIYDNQTSGTLLYSTNVTATTDSRGIYDIILSNINLPFDKQYFLGISVNNDTEMIPRINLTSVPYSLSANESQGLNATETALANQIDITSELNVGGGYNQGGLTLQSDGTIITQGDIIFSGNITILNVSNLNVNGSLIPDIDNSFDIGNGSNRWRNANFSGTVQIEVLNVAANPLGWTNLTSYPSACSAGEFISALGDNLTCGSPVSGLGGNSSSWLNTGTAVILANSSLSVGIGTSTPGAKLDISDTEDSEFIRLTDTTNGDTVGIFTGSGSPEGVVTAQRGSIYLDQASGSLYRKDSDIDSIGWVEVGTQNSSGTSTAHYAKATRSENQTIPTATFTLINFSATSFSSGAVVDTDNNSINITKSGKYIIQAAYLAEDIGDAGSARVRVLRNNTVIAESRTVGASAVNDVTPEVSQLLDLSAGDYINLEVFQSSGSNRNTTTDHQAPTLSVVEVDQSLTAAGGWVDSGGLVELDDSSDNVSANTLFVDNTVNRVGIGTSSPTVGKLQINQDADDATSGLAFFNAGATQSARAWMNGGTMNFNLDGTTVMSYDANNVGIATTSPAEKLVVIGNVNVSGTLNVSGRIAFPNLTNCDTIDTDANGVLTCGIDTGTAAAHNTSLWNNSGGNIFLRENAGNVGIGTSSPGADLDITAAEDTEFIRLSDSTNSDSIGIYTGSGSPEGVIIAQRGSLYIDHAAGLLYKKGTDVGSNNWEEITSTTSGSQNSTAWNLSGTNVVLNNPSSNVGIGIESPSQKLEVAGHLNATGVTSNSTFEGDVRIKGTLYGGSPIKVSGGINISGVPSGQDSFFIVNSQGNKIFRIDSQGKLNLSSNAGNASFGNATFAVDQTNDFVGIGTYAPNQRLHVIGNVNTTGTIYADALNITGTVEAAAFVGDPTLLKTDDLKTALSNNTGANFTELNINGDTNVTGTIYANALNITGTVEAAAFVGDPTLLKTDDLKTALSNNTGANFTELNINGDTNVTGTIYADALNITGAIQATAFVGDSTLVKVGNLQVALNNNTDANFTTLNVKSLALGWTNITNYPTACASGEFVTGVGDSLTCADPGQTSSAAGGWINNSDDSITTNNVIIGVTDLFVNTSTNRVGIGTDTPNMALVVVGAVNITDSLNVSGVVQAQTFQGDGSLLTGIPVYNNENLTNFIGSNASILRIGNISGLLQTVDAIFNIGNLTAFLGNNASIVRANNLSTLQNINSVFNQNNLTEFLGNNASIIRASNLTAYQLEATSFKNENATELLGENSSTSLWNKTGVNTFTREHTGNLGIGTSNPAKKLEVSDGADSVTVDPTATVPTINTTNSNNITIASHDGSVIIQLG